MKQTSKGLTPVVATVLLMTISVAAAASAYTFITGAQDDISKDFEDDLRQEEQISRSGMNMEYIYKNTGGNHTLLMIRNTGSISLPINESGRKTLNMFVDGQPVSSRVGDSGKGWKYLDSSMSQAPSDLVVLDQEETIRINTTATYPAEGGSKIIRITGPYETSDSHQCKNTGSPSC